jgi:hypothetical protein
MAHFAELDENNVVLRVLVTSNDEPDEGYSWLMETFGGKWVKTSYNGRIRKSFASVGGTYDEELDAFIPRKDFDSFVFDKETWGWTYPIPYPDDGQDYAWNEENLEWKLITP